MSEDRENNQQRYEDDFKTISFTSIFNNEEIKNEDYINNSNNNDFFFVENDETTQDVYSFSNPNQSNTEFLNVQNSKTYVQPETYVRPQETYVQPEETYVQSQETYIQPQEIFTQPTYQYEEYNPELIETEKVEENFNGVTETLNVIKEEPVQPQEVPEETKAYETIDETLIVNDVLNKIEEQEKIEEATENNVEKVEMETTNKKEKKKKKEKKEKIKYGKNGKEKLGFNWFLVFSLILVAIPTVLVINILMAASKETHTPVLGERLNNSIVEKISETQINTVASAVKSIDGVQNATTNLIVATVRISIDVKDDATEEEIIKIVDEAYNKVTSTLSVEKYFTQTAGHKQYDLEINAYNVLNSDQTILVTLNKNSSMEEYHIQVTSTPKNPDLVGQQ